MFFVDFFFTEMRPCWFEFRLKIPECWSCMLYFMNESWVCFILSTWQTSAEAQYEKYDLNQAFHKAKTFVAGFSVRAINLHGCYFSCNEVTILTPFTILCSKIYNYIEFMVSTIRALEGESCGKCYINNDLFITVVVI